MAMSSQEVSLTASSIPPIRRPSWFHLNTNEYKMKHNNPQRENEATLQNYMLMLMVTSRH